MITHCRIFSPSENNNEYEDLELQFVPKIENNHVVNIKNSGLNIDSIYTPKSIIIQLPNIVYTKLLFRESNISIGRKHSLDDLILRGYFEGDKTISVETDLLSNIELPFLPGWSNYILKENSEKKYDLYKCLEVVIRNRNLAPFIKLEQMKSGESPLDCLILNLFTIR
jgi:hypothetical protein